MTFARRGRSFPGSARRRSNPGKKTQSMETSATRHERPWDLHWATPAVAPTDADVEAREYAEVVRHAVLGRQFHARQEARCPAIRGPRVEPNPPATPPAPGPCGGVRPCDETVSRADAAVPRGKGIRPACGGHLVDRRGLAGRPAHRCPFRTGLRKASEGPIDRGDGTQDRGRRPTSLGHTRTGIRVVLRLCRLGRSRARACIGHVDIWRGGFGGSTQLDDPPGQPGDQAPARYGLRTNGTWATAPLPSSTVIV